MHARGRGGVARLKSRYSHGAMNSIANEQGPIRAGSSFFFYRMPANIAGLAALLLMATWLSPADSLEGEALALAGRAQAPEVQVLMDYFNQ